MDPGGRGKPALPLQAAGGHGSLPDPHDVRPLHQLVSPRVRQAEGELGELSEAWLRALFKKIYYLIHLCLNRVVEGLA